MGYLDIRGLTKIMNNDEYRDKDILGVTDTSYSILALEGFQATFSSSPSRYMLAALTKTQSPTDHT